MAAKWLIPEPLTEAALRLRDRGYDLFCPDLLYVEVGNVLWKKVRSREIEEETARPLSLALLDAPLRAEPSVAILPAAWEIAVRYDRSLYDSLYLALSVAVDARLVTADLRFFRAVGSTRLGDRMMWVEDLPA